MDLTKVHTLKTLANNVAIFENTTTVCYSTNTLQWVIVSAPKIVRTEAEVVASNFYYHNHSEEDCDLIICYRNDLKTESKLEIIEVREFIEVVRDIKEFEIISKIRGEDATENIVRFLAKEGNYGAQKTPNNIAKELADSEIKMYQQKVEKILSLFAYGEKEIFGYMKLSGFSYYWIKAEKETFKTWFKEWFGKDFEGEEL